jgi:beta-fructofuranosidase
VFPYPPPPFSELGDIDVVVDDEGRLHLFHLTLPNHDLVQHAVSDDGLRWESVPPALRTGDPGEADDDQIWTMAVFRDDARKRWTMLYTALARADGGRVQKTGMAVSADLIRWTKSAANPVAAADPRWYESDPNEWGSVSWRDPKLVRGDDGWLATICARERGGPLMRRGCVGLLASEDGERWQPRPPLFAPRRFWDLECPQAFPIGDRWFLTAATMEDRRQRYWTAPAFHGPYATPADGGILAPAGHYAGRVTTWQGQDLFWCWHQRDLAAGWTSTPRTVDWTPISNLYGKTLAPPLVLAPRPDGSLARRSFAGWDGFADEPRSVAPAPTTLFHDAPADGWRVRTDGGCMDVLAASEPVGDCRISGTLTLDGRHGGLAFRLDGEGGGYELVLRPDSAEVVLQSWLPTTQLLDNRRGYLREVLQREELPRPLPTGEPIPLSLLMVGPYLEVSLFGEVALATFSGARQDGPWGIWSESGSVTFDDIRLEPVRRP